MTGPKGKNEKKEMALQHVDSGCKIWKPVDQMNSNGSPNETWTRRPLPFRFELILVSTEKSVTGRLGYSSYLR